MLRILDERIDEKLGRPLHDRIHFLQIRFIAIECVMVPEVQAEPRAASGPHAEVRAVDRRRSAPQIGVVMRHPTARAVHILGGPSARFGKLIHQHDERLDALSQVARLGRPIVHFGVDVDRCICYPTADSCFRSKFPAIRPAGFRGVNY